MYFFDCLRMAEIIFGCECPSAHAETPATRSKYFFPLVVVIYEPFAFLIERDKMTNDLTNI